MEFAGQSEARPRAAVLTPSGRGAVATVVVEGQGATAVVGALFHPARGQRLGEVAIDRIVFGRWRGAEGEEVVVCRRGEETIEINCHGGRAAAAAILEALAEAGCQVHDWRSWVRSGESDTLRAAAVEALAAARTQRTAAILLDQWRGALRREVDQIAGLVASSPQAAEQKLDALLGRARLGLHLTTPFRVVLAGAPNVGKSSLINALVGYGRAIVEDEPGTTRDVVTAATALDGWPVELADTAGLRATTEALEAEGVARAQAQLAAADAIVLVFDRSRPWQPADESLASAWPQAILVHNKADLAPGDQAGRPAGLSTSAVAHSGIRELEAAIVKRIVPVAPSPGDAVPFTVDLVASLRQVREAIRRGDCEAAQEALRPLSQG